MSSPDKTNPVQEQLLQGDESSDRLAADNHELRRYWARTLVLILIPSIVTVWYATIWVRLVLGIENDDAVKYRSFSGSLIYYSWFIIGVFGLSWSKIGLTGVEVAMLQTPLWRAPNLVALMMHSNTTWNSPSGWVDAIVYREFHRLWCLLALTSILPFIAFPLSGLVFEISDGYIATSAQPLVMGRNATTFNEGYTSDGSPAEMAWEIGSAPTVPGFGLVYTAEGIDRTNHSCLSRVPNTMPLTEPIPDMFLPPQADIPVSGKAWGLRIKYNCSIVRSPSEFTILSEKPASSITHVARTQFDSPTVTLRTPSGDTITVFNTGNVPDANIWAHAEMGVNEQLKRVAYYNGFHPDFAPDDETKSMVFEYALWQVHFTSYYDEYYGPAPFNTTLDPVIEGMRSPFSMSEGGLQVDDAFFKIRAGGNFTVTTRWDNRTDSTAVVTDPVIDLRDYFTLRGLVNSTHPARAVAAPVGVRCVSSSGLGTATLHGETTTFSDFERADPKYLATDEPWALFGQTALDSLSLKFFTLYKASHRSPSMRHGSYLTYPGYIYPQALRRAVMLAYGLDALQLMYSIIPGADNAWVGAELTGAEEGKMLATASLIPGSGMGHFVLVLFCLWSGLSVAMGVVYGFRRRPSDRLDGESMFRKGVDLAGDVKSDGGAEDGKLFYHNEKFQKLPGS